jgi:GNAT superfamily N-acetyltransferase
MRIERFDPLTAQAEIQACHAMAAAGNAVDEPGLPPRTLSSFLGWWAYGYSGNPMQSWIATDDTGTPVGSYLLELPERDNRESAFAFVLVPPSHRRRGIGRALLGHLAARSADAGRRLLLSETQLGTPGDAFAAALGGTAGMGGILRQLDLDASMPVRLEALRVAAEAHAGGYELRSWQGQTPAELVDGLCAAYTAMADSPHDESFEPETWDAARLQAGEERERIQGHRRYSVGALSASGELAAITQVNVDPELPEWGWQQITAVIRPHRGHRLGLLAKVAMLEELAQFEPGLRHIFTGNAAPNQYMIAINEQLGFRITAHVQSWEHDVAQARTLSSPTVLAQS